MNYTLDEYQIDAADTAIYPVDIGIAYTILGLAGEAGELANTYKKILRDDGPLNNETHAKLIAELGDVLWYAAMIAHELDTDLSDVAARNIEKLQDRALRNKIGGSGDTR